MRTRSSSGTGCAMRRIPAKIRRQRLHVSLQDALHDYYRTTVCTGQIAAYTRYCFHLKAGTDELWLGANGLQDTEPHMNGNFFEFLWPNPTDGFSAPAWRSRQVYYQIFPERFKNGDPSRTPPGADAWGSAPTRENFMGGDLAGITQQLDYIQSLGATCLYLTPIFRAPSNHKYDTVDYFEIDPAFGTKDDLRRLVDGVHARGNAHPPRRRIQPLRLLVGQISGRCQKRRSVAVSQLVLHPQLSRRRGAAELRLRRALQMDAEVEPCKPGRAGLFPLRWPVLVGGIRHRRLAAGCGGRAADRVSGSLRRGDACV